MWGYGVVMGLECALMELSVGLWGYGVGVGLSVG